MNTLSESSNYNNNQRKKEKHLNHDTQQTVNNKIIQNYYCTYLLSWNLGDPPS